MSRSCRSCDRCRNCRSCRSCGIGIGIGLSIDILSLIRIRICVREHIRPIILLGGKPQERVARAFSIVTRGKHTKHVKHMRLHGVGVLTALRNFGRVAPPHNYMLIRRGLTTIGENCMPGGNGPEVRDREQPHGMLRVKSGMHESWLGASGCTRNPGCLYIQDKYRS